jgi:hypothetical protein
LAALRCAGTFDSADLVHLRQTTDLARASEAHFQTSERATFEALRSRGARAGVMRPRAGLKVAPVATDGRVSAAEGEREQTERARALSRAAVASVAPLDSPPGAHTAPKSKPKLAVVVVRKAAAAGAAGGDGGAGGAGKRPAPEDGAPGGSKTARGGGEASAAAAGAGGAAEASASAAAAAAATAAAAAAAKGALAGLAAYSGSDSDT